LEGTILALANQAGERRLESMAPSRPNEGQHRWIAEKTTVGKTVKFNRIPIGVVEDEVSLVSGDGEYNQFLQKTRLHEQKATELNSPYAYRWCYYALTEEGNALQFGESALLLSEPELQRILSEARSKNWPIL
jgi:hypothetical protein